MSESVDLQRLRGVLIRLGAFQAALLVALLFLIPLFGNARTTPLLAWLALIPVFVAGVALLYYQRVANLVERDDYSRETDARFTKAAYHHLGAGMVVWLAGLALIVYYL